MKIINEKKLNIKGRHPNISLPFIRAWIQASHTVLSYHGRSFDLYDYRFKIVDLDYRGAWGTCCRYSKVIELSTKITTPDRMGTVILHECIHAAMKWEEGTNEKCTSTLVSKLKPTVAIIAQTLVDNTFKNAAYIAHTSKGMAYPTKDNKDFYDRNQYVNTGSKDKYKKK
tara:strand:+ start:591 stop:1100 length:510 start_codon:yes stop_codon:yes gene_type:complete